MRRAEDILGLPITAGRHCAMATITPEQAKTILECQPSQRPVNDRHVQMLVGEITSGRFALTHQGIACDDRGLLFDGQHRLWACFLSGIAITVWVFFNEPRNNFEIVDTRGLARSNAQLALAKGQFTDARLAQTAVAAARFIRAYDLGRNPTQPNLTGAFTSADIDDILVIHPNLPIVAQQFATQAGRRTRLPSSQAAALFTLFAEADAGKAAIFQHQVLTGENLTKGDPAMTLRDSAASGVPTARGRAVDLTYRIARAWNLFYARKQAAKLYGANAPHAVPARKDGRDFFPEIAGYIRPSQR